MLPGIGFSMLGRGGGPGVRLITTTSASASGTSHSFSDVFFGADFPGRWIACMLFMGGGAQFSIPTVSAFTIGGVAAVGSVRINEWFPQAAGIYRAQPVGNSGTVSLTTAEATQCVLAVLSVGGYDLSATYDRQSNSNDGAGANGVSVNISVPARGLLLAAGKRMKDNDLVLTGVSERSEITFSGRVGVGFDNLLGAETGRAVSVEGPGPIADSTYNALEAQTFSPS